MQIGVATVNQVKNLLVQARIFNRSSKVNYTRALDKLAEYVDSPTRGTWQITPSGEKKVREFLNLPLVDIEIDNDTTSLEKLVASRVKDPLTRDYFLEGTDCLKINRLRASVVFLWAGAIHLIHQRLISKPNNALNKAIQRHDAKARQVKSIDDFEYIKESVVLLVGQDLKLFDKSQRQILEYCLDLRNKCGHPNKYSPGAKRVSAFIEDIVNIVF